jgi:hypothetical protein
MDGKSIENSFTEQPCQVNNQQHVNSILHHNINNTFNMEYSCWSRHPTATAIDAFGLFISLSIIIGV